MQIDKCILICILISCTSANVNQQRVYFEITSKTRGPLDVVKIIQNDKILFESYMFEKNKVNRYGFQVNLDMCDEVYLYISNRDDRRTEDGVFISMYGAHNNVVFQYNFHKSIDDGIRISYCDSFSSKSVWRQNSRSSTIPTNWYFDNFDDSPWDEYSLMNPISSQTGSHYYRISFTIFHSYTVYEFRLRYQQGVVAYLNNVEIYRDNMPSGPVTPSTPASGGYASMEYRGSIQSGSKLRTAAGSVNIFAVEYHFIDVSSTTKHNLVLDGFMSLYYGTTGPSSCYVYPYHIIPSLSTSADAELLVDHNVQTSVVLDLSTVSLSLELSHEVSASIDRISLFSPSASAFFDSIVVSGVVVDYEACEIVFMSSDIILQYNNYSSLSIYPQRLKYSRYTVDFRSSSDVTLAEINLEVCPQPNSLVFSYGRSVVNLITDDNSGKLKPTVEIIRGCFMKTQVNGFSVDKDTCIIEMLPTVEGVFSVEIECTQPYNMSTSVLFIVKTCEDSIVHITNVFTWPRSFSDYLRIVNSVSGEMVYENSHRTAVENGLKSDETLCLPKSRYELQLGCENSLFWAKSTSVLITYRIGTQYLTLLNNRFDTRVGTGSRIDLPLYFIIMPRSLWYYHMGSVANVDWFTSHSMGSWKQSKYNVFPSSPNSVQLYKKLFSLSSEELVDIQTVELAVRYHFGCIVYINGLEVFRDSVTDPFIVNTTSATKGMQKATAVSITLPTNHTGNESHSFVAYLILGENLIAVALIGEKGKQSVSEFDCSVTLSYETRIPRQLDYYSFGSDLSGKDVLENDGSSSVLLDTTKSKDVVVEYMQPRWQYVNKLVLQTSVEDNTYITALITVEGKINRDSDFESFCSTPIRLFNDNQYTHIWLHPIQLYSSFRVTITPYISQPGEFAIQSMTFKCDNSHVDHLLPEYGPISVYLGCSVLFIPLLHQVFHDVKVDRLPLGLYVDSLTGYIYGTPEVLGYYSVFTSAIRSDSVSVCAFSFISVTECQSFTKTIIKIRLNAGEFPPAIQFVLSCENDQSISYSNNVLMNPYDTYEVMYCLPYGTYSLNFYNKDVEWGSTSRYVVSTLDGMVITSGRFGNNHAKRIVLFSSTVIISNSLSQWKYFSQEKISSNWNTLEYDDTMWPTSIISSIYSTGVITTYLRSSINIKDPFQYNGFILQLYYRGGIAVYYNGDMISLFNLPSDFTSSTHAISDHNFTYPKRVILTSLFDLIKPNHGVIAIEVHDHIHTFSKLPLKVWIWPASDREIYSGCDISMFENASLNLRLFLSRFETDMVRFTSPITVIEWSIDNAMEYRGNSILLSTSQCDKLSIEFSGAKLSSDDVHPDWIDLEDWTPILVKKNMRMTDRGDVLFDVPDAMMGFKHFRLVLDISQSAFSSIVVYVFNLALLLPHEEFTVCPAIEYYPQMLQGWQSPGPCPEFMYGVSTRLCNGTLQEVNLSRCRMKAPKAFSCPPVHAYVNAPLITVKCEWINMITSMESDDPIPRGIVLSNDGTISGTFLDEAEGNYSLVVRVKNTDGLATAVVYISSIFARCYEDGMWNETIVTENTMKYVFCDKLTPGLSGVVRRTCTLNATGARWTSINRVCFRKIDITVSIVSGVIFLSVFVMYVYSSIKSIIGVRRRNRISFQGF